MGAGFALFRAKHEAIAGASLESETGWTALSRASREATHSLAPLPHPEGCQTRSASSSAALARQRDANVGRMRCNVARREHLVGVHFSGGLFSLSIASGVAPAPRPGRD